MTCWALRNTLLPVLWKNTEGCVVRQPYDADNSRKTWPVRSMRLSFVEPEDRHVCPVGVFLLPFEQNSPAATPQGPICRFILQGCPKGSDDKVR